MRIDVVHPEEEGLVGAESRDASQRRVGRQARDLGVTAVIVGPESPGEPALGADQLVRDHSKRLVAARREQLCERSDLWIENIGELPDARAVRIRARKKRAERGRRPCDGRHGLLEVEASSDQRVEEWRRRSIVAVHAHVVGAQCVDRHQEDTGLGVRARDQRGG